MIELVSGTRELKNRIKKLLNQSSSEFLFLNYLAEISIFWCGTSEKTLKVNSGNMKMML